MATPLFGGTCAVIVTYGARSNLCEQAATAATGAGVGHVVIVDNGSVPAARTHLMDVAAASHGRVSVVRMATNSGSARGVGVGLTAALERAQTQDIWILDDDNVPRSDALSELMRARNMLAARRLGAASLVTSCRVSYSVHRALRAHASLRGVVPARGAFVNFNLLDVPAKALSKAGLSRRRVSTAAAVLPKLPYGPYGGLLLPRSVATAAGLPRCDYYLYEDDAEYTRRLVEAGYDLILVTTSVIDDVDTNWYASARGRNLFTRTLLASSDLRVFYATRNRVAFEKQYWDGVPGIRRLNRAAYVSGLFAASLATGRVKRYRLVMRAIRDGEAGALGIEPELTL